MSQQDRILLLLGSDLVDAGGRARIQKHSPSHCHSVNIEGITVICTPDATQFCDKHVLDLVAFISPVQGTSHRSVFYLMVERGTQLGKWVNVFGKSVCENIQTLCKETRQLVENPLPSNHKTWQSLGQPYTSQQLVEEILSKRKDSGPSEISVDKYRGNQGLNLVLLGEKGSGKSASGNTILGEERFRSVLNSKATTTRCEERSKNIYGTDVKVIDTPDFFDDDLQDRDHAVDCSRLCAEYWLCVYLIVIQIGRFSVGEKNFLEKLEKALPITRDKTIILFTYGDDLGSQNIDQYIRKTNKNFQKLFSQCGQRCQVFNNQDKKGKKQQANELMRKIAELVNTTEDVQVFPELTAVKKSGILSSLGLY